MGSRLLPLALAAGALLADGLGLHQSASYLVLLTVPAAAAAAFAAATSSGDSPCLAGAVRLLKIRGELTIAACSG